MGLKHILGKHGGEFGDIAGDLNAAIKDGKLTQQNEARTRIEHGNVVVGLTTQFNGEKRNVILTSYDRGKKGGADTSSEPHFTAGSHNTPANPSEILPNSNLKSAKTQAARIDTERAAWQ